MDIDEEAVQTLLNMGFPSEGEIRRALKLAKQDLSEAVAILTNENSTNTFDTMDDIEMKETDRGSTSRPPMYGPYLPNTYDESLANETSQISPVSNNYSLFKLAALSLYISTV